MAETTEGNAVKPQDKIDETTLKAIISDEIENALGKDGDLLSTQRLYALRHYLGEKYGDEPSAPTEVNGRSQVVDRTVLETIEWILPALLRIFTGNDRVVNVEPQRPEDEDIAKQQEEYANYIFMRDNPGFQNLYVWFKDALLQKLGWLKVYWDIDRKVETENYSGLTDQEYQAIIADPNVEVVDKSQYPAFGPIMGLQHAQDTVEGQQPEANGSPRPSPKMSPPADPLDAQLASMAPMVWDCTIRRTLNEGRVRIEPVAPEELLITRRARHVRDSAFTCHRRQITKTELLEMGFDADTVENLSYFDEQEFNQERIERLKQSTQWPYISTRTDEAMVTTWINECYIKVDWNQDGKAELRKIVTAGTKTTDILSNDEADEVPFVALTPVLMPHVLVGLSLEDLVADVQKIKTVLWRQSLDNLYLANNARTYVNELAVGENTYDDLLTSRPGGIVRGKGPKDGNIEEMNVEFVAAQTFPMLEYLDQLTEKRSGVSKGNQGVAPDDLNQNSAIGSMGIGMLQEAAAQRVELIARIFAEGLRECFGHVLGLVARNQQSPRVVKLTGGWTPVDPTSWKHSFDMTVSVGLGTGNKDKTIQQLMQLLGMQKDTIVLQKSAEGPLVTLKNVYHTWKQLVSAMGFKNVDDFVTNPETNPMPQQPQQPDPKTQAATIQSQAMLQKQTMANDNALKLQQLKGLQDAQMKYVQDQMEAAMKKYQTDVDALVSVHTAHITKPPPVEFGGRTV